MGGIPVIFIPVWDAKPTYLTKICGTWETASREDATNQLPHDHG